MKKIAFFVEGQSEQIFVRDFVIKLYINEIISFECFKLHKENMVSVPSSQKNPNAKYHFTIIDVQGDGKVLSVIKEREKAFFKKGYDKIIGLRDMYSKEYRKNSQGKIDRKITKAYINGHNSTIHKMSNPTKIDIYFAIMELEAWFLGMYKIFAKLSPKLTLKYIEQRLGYDLSKINPQTKFFQPAIDLNNIFQLSGSRYRKKQGDIEKIVNKVEISDYNDAMENGRCQSFKEFYDDIVKCQ